MRIAGDRVGPRGLLVLGIAGLAGIALAVHGWSVRHAVIAPGSLAGGSPSAAASSPGHGGSSAPGPTASTGGPASPGATASPGPLLRSQSFASYSFLVWPGNPDAAAKAAMTGLSISVHRSGSGLSVAAGVTGQPPQAPHVYQGGAKVYVIEASLGDDANNSDYNLGDDGLVVTDSAGRIIQ
ncbi:MAG TPA: hypothetical protein VKS82_15305 [Streptosporangiaceae bacterium]|jgi:hypothetical protein|nr:hypothetical protein [Streptosporangiaceae bacterium]